MLKKIDHVVITTGNAEACLSFYQTLGFRVVDHGSHYELYGGDFKINVHILHQELEPKAEYVTCGSTDVCFEVDDDLLSLYQSFKDKKMHLISEPVTRYGVRGKMQSIYLRDPDGNLIELCSYR